MRFQLVLLDANEQGVICANAYQHQTLRQLFQSLWIFRSVTRWKTSFSVDLGDIKKKRNPMHNFCIQKHEMEPCTKISLKTFEFTFGNVRGFNMEKYWTWQKSHVKRSHPEHTSIHIRKTSTFPLQIHLLHHMLKAFHRIFDVYGCWIVLHLKRFHCSKANRLKMPTHWIHYLISLGFFGKLLNW